MLSFTKMNGAGNDFVLLDNRDGALALARTEIARLCDRHRGVGADGVLVVERAENGADFRMRYYNADGGEAEMCGNGARCFARYAGRLAGRDDKLNFETPAGVIAAQLCGENVRLQMSAPKDLQRGIAISIQGERRTLEFINTGVPHAVLFVDDLENFPVRAMGATVRYHERFAPKGTNANFVKQNGDGTISIRTYERGVEDETLACGTGVVAAALLHSALTGARGPIGVRVRGGDRLEVDFDKAGDAFANVTLTGPADFVFDGAIAL